MTWLRETRREHNYQAISLHSLETKKDDLQSKLDGSLAGNHELHKMLDAVKAENTQLLKKSEVNQDNVNGMNISRCSPTSDV